MKIAPESVVGRAVAALWLVLCAAVLLFGFVQREIHDMPIAFLWFLIFLSFPVGLLAVFLFSVLCTKFCAIMGVPYVPFWSELPLWFAAVVAGYIQWFVLLPRAALFLAKAKRQQ